MIYLFIAWLIMGLAALSSYVHSQIKYKWEWRVEDILVCFQLVASGLFGFLVLIIPRKILRRVIIKGHSCDSLMAAFDIALETIEKEQDMTVEEQATLLYLIEEYCNARINNLPASHQHGYSNIQQEIELLDKIKKTYKHKEGMMNRNHIEIMKEELGSEVSSLTSEMDRKIIGFQVQTKNGRLQMTKYRIEGDGRDLTSLIMTHDDGSEVCNFAITDGGLRVLKEAIELYQNGGLIERPAKAALLPNGDGDIVEDVLVKLVNPIEEIRRKNEH